MGKPVEVMEHGGDVDPHVFTTCSDCRSKLKVYRSSTTVQYDARVATCPVCGKSIWIDPSLFNK